MSTVTEAEETATDEAAPPPARKAPRGRLPWLVAGIALIVWGVGAFVVSTGYDAPREFGALAPNLPVNDGARNPLDISATNSPSLVRNPVDPANLVVTSKIDSPRYSCGVSVSFDGGGRWTQTAIPVPAGVTGPCYAPDAVFGADGTLYLSFVTLTGRANSPDAAYLTMSADGGKTLAPPRETPLGARAFHSRLSADPKVPGRLYLTWVAASEIGLYRFSQPGNPINAIRSDDGGRNWTQPTRVSSPARERAIAPSPVVGPDGALNVLYLDLGDDELDYAGGHGGRSGRAYDGDWELVLARSRDGGKRWEESRVGTVKPAQRFIVFTPPFPSLAIDQRSGKLFASFTDKRAGDADVSLWSLDPGAERWSGPVRVNDTPRADGTAQYQPRLAVTPGGRLDVLYYDRRRDRTNRLNEVSFQSSFDGGETFRPHVRLSDKAFSSRIGFGADRGMADLGGRLGLVSDDRRALAVWTDTRAGTRISAKQDLARGLVAFNDPPRLSDSSKTLLRVSALALILVGLAVAIGLGVLGGPRAPTVRRGGRVPGR
ncbi:MAG: exo-alpha-sialidase [Solirubrobacterales bacterium]|nr:exo-alpha-sialidase [Solirubrobacterales bacterium]